MTTRSAQTSARPGVLRPLVALGAALTALALSAGPALAVPPPEPYIPDERSGSTSFTFAAPTAAPDTVSTAQVVAISFAVALLVGVLLVIAVAALTRWLRTRRTAPQLPAQRGPASLPAKDPIGAG